MSRIDLLQALKEFSEEAVGDIRMPVSVQKGDAAQDDRAAEVHLMRLPDSTSARKKAPYIIHQLITAKDQQSEGQWPEATAQVRSIFCVYNSNEEEGALMLLNLVERLRIALLRRVVIGDRYELDLKTGLEALYYPDDTAPYFMGEMVSTWRLPPVQREVRQWL